MKHKKTISNLKEEPVANILNKKVALFMRQKRYRVTNDPTFFNTVVIILGGSNLAAT